MAFEKIEFSIQQNNGGASNAVTGDANTHSLDQIPKRPTFSLDELRVLTDCPDIRTCRERIRFLFDLAASYRKIIDRQN